jgi:formamidopyrimidine-DNA glycosylase
MPELPEVETIVRTLRPGIISRRIEVVRLNRSDIINPPRVELAKLLQNRTITSLARRGKKIVFQLDAEDRFFIHLGMTGRLTLENPDASLAPHTHLILSINRQELRFVDPRRFGGIFWLGKEKSPDDGLGPEPLDMTTDDLTPRLKKTRRAIKTALLDQKLIAGVGNIYADEALFIARINPRTLASRLSRDQVEQLTAAIKTVLIRAIEHRGSTLRDYRDANGNPGAFQKIHQVYDRESQPCLVCGTPIRRIVLGQRSTHFCPQCQVKAKSAKRSATAK